MQSIYIEAGKRIRKLREIRGVSREEFAERIGISSKFLYEIETGKKGFSAQTLSLVAEGLDTSCDYILFGV